MCGIAGIWRRDGGPVGAWRARAMGKAVAHRGPDAIGCHETRSLNLLSYRFNLEDHEGGVQPAKHEGVTVVWNGEIFNWQELAERYGFENVTGDTVLLPRLFAALGFGIVEEFNGQFAIAAWDHSRQELLLARDAAGILPLIYRATPGEIVFASELTGLLADPETPATFDMEAMTYFMRMGFFGAPQTPIAGVRQLGPGSAIVFSPTGSRSFRFGKPTIEPNFDGDLGTAAGLLAELMENALARRLSGDSPDGLFLSGGVDSALLGALLQRMNANRPWYTVGFTGSGKLRSYHFIDGFERGREVYGEFAPAGATAAALAHAPPIHVAASAESLIDDFARIIRRQDIPCMSISTPPLHYLTGRAAQDIRVAFSGGGADELFAGYSHCDPRHYAGASSTLDSYLELTQIFSPDELREIGSPLASHAHEVRDVLQVQVAWSADVPEEGLPFVLAAERLGPLPQNILQKNDRIGMANPLEMRYPFLDNNVVAFAERLPVSLLAGEDGGKLVVKEAAKLLGVPHEIAYRPKIRLQAPYATYLDDPEFAAFFVDLIADPPPNAPQLYEPEKALAYLFGPVSRSVWRRPAKIMLLATWNQWVAEMGFSTRAG